MRRGRPAGGGRRPLYPVLAGALLAGTWGSPGTAQARVLPPRASEVLSRAFQQLDPGWRLDRAHLEPERARVTLCPAPSGECVEVRLEDPEAGGCPGDRLAAWCLLLPDGAPEGLRQALHRVLDPVRPEEVWVSLEGDAGDSQDSGPEVAPEPDAVSSPGMGHRLGAALGLLFSLVLPLLGGIGVMRLARLHGHARARRIGLVIATVAGIGLGVSLPVLPLGVRAEVLWGGTWFLLGLLLERGLSPSRRKSLAVLGTMLGVLTGHGLGAELLLSPGALAGDRHPLQDGLTDPSDALEQTCEALFPEQRPAPEAFQEMRRLLGEEASGVLWLHLGVWNLVPGLSGPSWLEEIRAVDPKGRHGNGFLPADAVDVPLFQALAWTLPVPRPRGVVLYLRPERDIPGLGQRSACCGARPLFRFPPGESIEVCEGPDARERWKVLLGHLPVPRAVGCWQDSRLATRLARAWRNGWAGLLSSRDDRAAALSRFRTLLPWVRDRLAERGVRLVVVVLPSPRERPVDLGWQPGREWAQVMDLCRLANLSCLDARHAGGDPASDLENGSPPPVRTDGRSPTSAGRRLARWLVEHLASLEDDPALSGGMERRNDGTSPRR